MVVLPAVDCTAADWRCCANVAVSLAGGSEFSLTASFAAFAGAVGFIHAPALLLGVGGCARSSGPKSGSGGMLPTLLSSSSEFTTDLWDAFCGCASLARVCSVLARVVRVAGSRVF